MRAAMRVATMVAKTAVMMASMSAAYWVVLMAVGKAV